MIELGLRRISPAALELPLFCCYGIFLAGFFFMPQATEHYKVYYLLVFVPLLLVGRQILGELGRNPLWVCIQVYLAYMTASIFWSESFVWPAGIEVMWHTLLVASFIIVTAWLAQQSPQRYDTLLRYMVYVASIAAVVSILVFYANNPFPKTRLQPPVSRMDNAVLASCVYGLFCLIAAYYVGRAEPGRSRITYLLCVSVLLTAMLLSQSRAALAALGVGLILLQGRRGLMFVAVLVVIVATVFALEPQLWQQQLNRGLSFRPGIWQAVWDSMPGHWLFGQGYLVNTVVRIAPEDVSHAHAHSVYLATLRDGGIVGLSLLAVILGLAVYWAAQLWRRDNRLYLALLGFAMVCVASDTDRLLTRPKEQWLFFWLPIALIMAAQSRHRSVMAPTR